MINRGPKQILFLFQKWNQFWFESDGILQLSVFRFVFALILLAHYLTLWPDLELFYSESGIYRSQVFEEFLVPHRYTVLQYFTGIPALGCIYGLLLISLLALALGFLPRVFAILAFVLHISFLYRNMAIAYGVDTVSSFFLFYLSMGSPGARPTSKRSALTSMAYRLLQIQVCVIYAYSGFGKLRGTKWWMGDALWDALANSQLARFDFSWLSSVPLLIVFMTYLTVLWEIYFPALVWFQPTRKLMLTLGVFMHLGIAISLNLSFFAGLMVASYLLFLNPSEIAWGLNQIQFFRRKFAFSLKSR